jgi:hypothetical protein
MQTAINPKSDKANTLKLSQQVREILFKAGYSCLFNFDDYRYFKRKTKGEFSRAHAIARMIIEDYDTNSDYIEYEF